MTILKNKLSYKENILFFSIVFVFLIEFLITIYINTTANESVRFIGYYKIIFQVLLIITINLKIIPKVIIYCLLGLLLLFCVNQFINPSFFNNIQFHLLKGSVYYFDKYIFIFIFILAFMSWSKKDQIGFKVLVIIEKILLINSLFILAGVCFDLNIFKSYPFTSRFGFDGLFNKVNEASFLYIIYISSLYYKLVVNGKKNLPLLIYIIGIGLLLGTKTVILFLVLLAIFHVVKVVKMKKYIRIIVVLLIFSFVVFFEKIAYFYFDLFPFWNHLMDKHSLITLLLSKRDILLMNSLEYIELSWTSLNYLIGGPFYNESYRAVEMDFADVFLYFGIIGIVIYSFLIIKLFLINKDSMKIWLLIFVFLCGLMAGGLLLSVMAMLYLYLTSIHMKKT